MQITLLMKLAYFFVSMVILATIYRWFFFVAFDRVEINPPAVAFCVTQSQLFTATMYDKDGNDVTSRVPSTPEWSIGDPAVAEGAHGSVTAKARGTTALAVQFPGTTPAPAKAVITVLDWQERSVIQVACSDDSSRYCWEVVPAGASPTSDCSAEGVLCGSGPADIPFLDDFPCCPRSGHNSFESLCPAPTLAPPNAAFLE